MCAACSAVIKTAWSSATAVPDTRSVSAGAPAVTSGSTDGDEDGDPLGLPLGLADGDALGLDDGDALGASVTGAPPPTTGDALGDADGDALGLPLGLADGDALGESDGDALGLDDGVTDGASVSSESRVNVPNNVDALLSSFPLSATHAMAYHA